ncbi:Hypothetical_protein [Hexamita inflata]|uniref:Hypothetical_protein n=1 Tax=Hexamita inflata TaxID=28002 RepID=A0AA86TXW0_9EUKA|nr:Hypothetical protein HINF_LOCUS20116 [Hexamita inflata]
MNTARKRDVYKLLAPPKLLKQIQKQLKLLQRNHEDLQFLGKHRNQFIQAKLEPRRTRETWTYVVMKSLTQSKLKIDFSNLSLEYYQVLKQMWLSCQVVQMQLTDRGWYWYCV